MSDFLSEHLEFSVSVKFITTPNLEPPSSLQSSIAVPSSKKSAIRSVQTFDSISFDKKNSANTQNNAFGQRIHAKQYVKKITNRMLRPKKVSILSKISDKKENISQSNLKLQIRQSQSRKNRKKREKTKLPITLQLKQELDKVKNNRSFGSTPQYEPLSSNPYCQISSLDFKADKTPFISEKIDKDQAEILKKVDNYIENDNQNRHLKANKKGRCFYDKLKQKLSRQVNKIHDQHSEDKPKLIIQGCNMKSRPSEDLVASFRTPLTERCRPITAMSRAGALTSREPVIIKQKRPLSSRTKTLQKRQLEYLRQQIEQKSIKEINSYTCTPSRLKKTKSRLYIEPKAAKSLRHIIPKYKRKNQTSNKAELQTERVNQKMLNILIDCHAEQTKNSNIEGGMKIFEKYCKTMNSNLCKKSRMMDKIKKTTNSDEEIQQL